MNRISREFELFLSYKEKLSHSFEIDDYGFAVGGKGKIDLLLTALVHGDEVGGIQIVNEVLRELQDSKKDLGITVGFLLCNVKAALSSKRFLEKDLNRSFLVDKIELREEERASEISKIVGNSKFILDFHQTVEPTEKPFFIFERNDKLIDLANVLLPEIPIVTFATEGFSGEGKTMLEYASTVDCDAIAIECGQAGFCEVLSKKISALTFKLIDNLKEENLVVSAKGPIEHFHIDSTIENTGGDYLIPGLINHMKVNRGQLIGHRKNGSEIVSNLDGRLYFPRYGELAESSPVLCDLAKSVK